MNGTTIDIDPMTTVRRYAENMVSILVHENLSGDSWRDITRRRERLEVARRYAHEIGGILDDLGAADAELLDDALKAAEQ